MGLSQHPHLSMETMIELGEAKHIEHGDVHRIISSNPRFIADQSFSCGDLFFWVEIFN